MDMAFQHLNIISTWISILLLFSPFAHGQITAFALAQSIVE
jgi:hypothetical protein